MPLLKIQANNFNLSSEYYCRTEIKTNYTDETHEVIESQTTELHTSEADAKWKTITFKYDLPDNTVVKSAKVYATIDQPLYGAQFSIINGTSVGVGKTASVDVDLKDGESSVVVSFGFKTKTQAHDHRWDMLGTITESGEYYDIRNILYDHVSVLSYTNVYLEIEYGYNGGGYMSFGKKFIMVPSQ